MIQEIATMSLWALVTLFGYFTGAISSDFGYIGMCIMLAAGLLFNEGT